MNKCPVNVCRMFESFFYFCKVLLFFIDLPEPLIKMAIFESEMLVDDI